MKKKTKIISYILGISLFISSFKLEFRGILNKEKIETTKNKINTEKINDTKTETTIEIDNKIYETINESKQEENTIQTITNINTEKDFNEESIKDTSIIETENQKEETKSYEQLTDEVIFHNQIVTATTNVNIRTSNTTESLKIGNLKINEQAIKILSCENNWTLVKTSNQIGYVCNDYLTTSNTSKESIYNHKKHNDIVITTTDLNIRMNPNTDAEIIKTFEKNTELEVIAKVNNGWLLVKNNGIIGYVHGDYTISLLEKVKEQYPHLNIQSLNIEKIVRSTANTLNIRANNNTESKIIRTLDKYESVRVLKEYGDWYFIMTNEYEFGFINKNYTKTLNGIFVVVDISRQRAYLYNNNELYLIGFVTTGKSSTPSDIGLFSIWYKGMNEEITPGHFVHFWMPYNLAYEGLHDAEEWREWGYGTDNYINNGSNGCINMRYVDAKTIYENVSIGTKVLVHK